MAYRDDALAYRERLHSALRELSAAWRGVQDRLELLEVLGRQLRDRGMAAPKLPVVKPPLPIADPGPETSAADLVRLAGAAEAETRRLAASRQELDRLAELLNRRARGEQVDLPLAPGPRRVPGLYVLAEMSPSALLLVLPLSLMALAMPVAFGEFSLALLLGLLGLGLAGSILLGIRRARFLGRCEVAASVTVADRSDGLSSMKNWPVRRSNGWDVRIESYTGSGRRDVLEFLAQDGRRGRLVVRGTGYDGGAVLYDPDTLRAYDVKQLGCAPRPDANGGWAPRLPGEPWFRVVLLLVFLGGWGYLALGTLVALLR